MKKIIVISCAIILLVLFYYPVFDSEKISYALIFSCFVAICFSGAKIYAPSDKEDYESIEKEIDRQHADDGIFEYTKEGFYILRKKSKRLHKMG